MDSELVQPARIQECPVHLEARVRATHELGGEKLRQIGGAAAVEVEILRVHVATHLILRENYIDPAKWSPLIYNFRHYYRPAENELGKTFRAQV